MAEDEAAPVATEEDAAPVAAMEELMAGFNTKSNFNREFLRVMGVAPREWLKTAALQDVGDKAGDLAR